MFHPAEKPVIHAQATKPALKPAARACYCTQVSVLTDHWSCETPPSYINVQLLITGLLCELCGMFEDNPHIARHAAIQIQAEYFRGWRGAKVFKNLRAMQQHHGPNGFAVRFGNRAVLNF